MSRKITVYPKAGNGEPQEFSLFRGGEVYNRYEYQVGEHTLTVVQGEKTYTYPLVSLSRWVVE